MRAETLATASSRWRTCAAVLVLIAFAAGTACAQNAITGISVSQQPDRVIIKVQGNWALKMTPLISKSGSYLGFQFPCKLTAKGRLVGIRSGRIYNVRYSNFSTRPMSTRVVINSRGHLDYSTVWSPDRHSVEIHVMKQRISAATKPVAVNASPVPGGGEPATEPASAVEIAAVPVVPAAASVPAAEAKGAEPTVRVMGMAEVSTSGAQEPTTVAAPVPVSEPVRHVTPRPAETRQLMARAASAE